MYKDCALVWAARSPLSVPAVALAVGSFGSDEALLRGLVVSLGGNGEVLVSYMGTDPPTNTVGANEPAQELNYERMDAEHRKPLMNHPRYPAVSRFERVNSLTSSQRHFLLRGVPS